MNIRYQAGFTVSEVSVAAAITITVLSTTLLSMLSATDLMGEAMNRSVVQEKLTQSVQRIAFELRWSEGDAVLITQENGWDRIDFSVATGYESGETVWSPGITYRVEPSTTDVNGNGIPDEGRLVRIQGGTTQRLYDGVAPGGFTVQRLDNNVTLQVSLIERHHADVLTATAQTSTSIRN